MDFKKYVCKFPEKKITVSNVTSQSEIVHQMRKKIRRELQVAGKMLYNLHVFCH
jgi:hypothetical protein